MSKSPGRPEVLDVIAKGRQLLTDEHNLNLELHAAGNLYSVVAMLMALKPVELVMTEDSNNPKSPRIVVRMQYAGQ